MANNANIKKQLSELRRAAGKVRASFNALFQTPLDGRLIVRNFDHRSVAEAYGRLVDAIASEIDTFLETGTERAPRLVEPDGSVPDSVDYLNHLAIEHGGASLKDSISAGVLDVMTAGTLFDSNDNARNWRNSPLGFQLAHAKILVDEGGKMIAAYIDILRRLAPDGAITRLHPDVDALLEPGAFLEKGEDSGAVTDILRRKAMDADAFRIGRVFRYSEGEFAPVELAPIRKVDEFFGYQEARAVFNKYFSAFEKQEENLPLFISSHPGLGKTHLTISHALASGHLTLILPEPENLGRPLGNLAHTLAARKNRKFVVFFDDIDAPDIDWYHFRTQVGGSFALPPNVTIVVASNSQFPANVLSRGRSVSFPMFDELECQKMVEDFLKYVGMRNPPSALVSVIAADYVEEYGQHIFEELSPRTLSRYLDRYKEDADKRKRTLELSRSEVIAVPDAQAFREANQKVAGNTAVES